MGWIITGVSSAALAGWAYLKGRFQSAHADAGITPGKVMIYGGAALTLYLILKRNKVI